MAETRPQFTSPTYKEWFTGEHCDHQSDNQNQPCWGRVDIGDEDDDGSYILACEGHECIWINCKGVSYEQEPQG